MIRPQALGFAVLFALVAGAACQVSIDKNDSSTPARSDVTGAYLTEANGTTFGKPWAYSGALVLDSTGHFGAVFNASGSLKVQLSDSADREGMHGTYIVQHGTSRSHGTRVRTTTLELRPEGRHDRLHLRMNGDSLRFLGPWWLSAGLSAVGIGDPVFVRVADSLAASVSASSTPATIAAASSTPALKKRR